MFVRFICIFLGLLLWGSGSTQSVAETTENPVAVETGYRLLTEKPYLPPDFNQATFDEVWRVWPEPLRSRAERASKHERRQMAFQRYGLTKRPEDDSRAPLQYVVDEGGNWAMNCFACHGGSVLGTEYPGAPNSNFELATLTEEIRKTKLRLGKPLTRMDVGSILMPLGTTRGTTNAVMFGVALMAYRNPDLTRSDRRLPPSMTHHDMDAPPWWHFHRKKNLYIDGFAPSGARPLMQFMLVEENGPEDFKSWEADYQNVYAYLMSLRPPKYQGALDDRLVAAGRAVFERSCAECHGTYGAEAYYPERMVSLAEIGTDPVRHEALTSEHRGSYHRSWFAHFGKKEVITDPDGYVAPPLDGVWASAPYFHNGSVPTLWHLLHPDERPVVWRRHAEGFDEDRVGFVIDQFWTVPKSVRSSAEKRQYFDTRRNGKSAMGHDFVDQLTADEKKAVLEYLKTL